MCRSIAHGGRRCPNCGAKTAALAPARRVARKLLGTGDAAALEQLAELPPELMGGNFDDRGRLFATTDDPRILEMLPRESAGVQARAAANPNLPAEVQAKLAESPKARVRAALAWNPRLSENARDLLLADEHPAVWLPLHEDLRPLAELSRGTRTEQAYAAIAAEDDAFGWNLSGDELAAKWDEVVAAHRGADVPHRIGHLVEKHTDHPGVMAIAARSRVLSAQRIAAASRATPAEHREWLAGDPDRETRLAAGGPAVVTPRRTQAIQKRATAEARTVAAQVATRLGREAVSAEQALRKMHPHLVDEARRAYPVGSAARGVVNAVSRFAGKTLAQIHSESPNALLGLTQMRRSLDPRGGVPTIGLSVEHPTAARVRETAARIVEQLESLTADRRTAADRELSWLSFQHRVLTSHPLNIDSP